MMRSCLLMTALCGVLAAPAVSAAAYRGEIIPETVAARHGLTRMWYSQIQLDRARARAVHVLLDRGTLFVQTDHATLHALDAETGQTLWATQVGRRNHPSMRPAANRDLVAVINGSYLYILNRHNGKLLWETQIDGAPGAGPALSEQRAYTACVNGLVLAYLVTSIKDPRLELGIIQSGQTEQQAEELERDRRDSIRLQQEYEPPLTAQSTGRAIVQPLVTRENEGEEYVAWPTDLGYLFVGYIDRNEQDRFSVRYRLETAAGITAQPTYLPPEAGIVGDSGVIYAASRDGYVHAIRENGGTALWRFSTGEPLVEPAVVVGKRVFSATQPGGMYCLDAKTGEQVWWCPQLLQFIAASRNRLYAVDRLGEMVVVDFNTGARLDAIPFPAQAVRMINDQNDRIYIVTATGLVQCLREVENEAAVVHRVDFKSQPAGPPATEQVPAEPPGAAQPGLPAAPAENPFGAPGAGGNPFGGAGAAAPGGGAAENPFGAADNPFN